MKTPTARPYTPRSTEVLPGSSHWDRDAMFASGALTLGELLQQVPGVTILTTGFILAPQVAGWYGDPGGMRIFIDGVERDPVNVRNGGITDLAAVPLFAFEDIRVERAAGELRVHLRTWRVERTTPSTRTDILTGSENLNLYRGFFGTRLGNGAVFQVAGQQSSTISRVGMDGDALGALARVGWARGDWSVDGTFLRQGLNRSAGVRFPLTSPQLNALPPFKGSEGLAYLRVAWRDPEADGPWVQLTASTINAGENTASSSLPGSATPPTTGTTTVADSADTTRAQSQYILAAGMTRWGLRLSTTNRIRSVGGRSLFSPGVRAEYDSRLLTVSAFGEHSADSTTRTDVLARFAPIPWLNLGAAVSRAAPKSVALGPAVTSERLEAAVRLRDRWLTGGIVRRSASMLAPPIELDSILRRVSVPAGTGLFVGVRGEIWRGFMLDVDAVQWDAVAFYRPQNQVRTRIWFESSFLGTFPRNTFHLFLSGTFESRSTLVVPGTDSSGQRATPWNSMGTLLEIRIGTAVISWQTRNILATPYETYPGYLMPRLVNLYGVRWEFWN